MKKTALTLLMLLFSVSAFCNGKSFYRIGKYYNVRIRSITHRGINIMHRNGVCFITEQDMSPAEARLLSSELAIYRQKLQAYEENIKMWLEFYQNKFDELSKKLPTMSLAEIEAWVAKELKKKLSSNDFSVFFRKKFGRVANGEEVLQKILQRVTQLQDQEIADLKKSACFRITPKSIRSFSKN